MIRTAMKICQRTPLLPQIMCKNLGQVSSVCVPPPAKLPCVSAVVEWNTRRVREGAGAAAVFCPSSRGHCQVLLFVFARVSLPHLPPCPPPRPKNHVYEEHKGHSSLTPHIPNKTHRYKKHKAACEKEGHCEMGGFTRLLHSGRPDNLMDEIPTVVVDPLPKDKVKDNW